VGLCAICTHPVQPYPTAGMQQRHVPAWHPAANRRATGTRATPGRVGGTYRHPIQYAAMGGVASVRLRPPLPSPRAAPRGCTEGRRAVRDAQKPTSHGHLVGGRIHANQQPGYLARSAAAMKVRLGFTVFRRALEADGCEPRVEPVIRHRGGDGRVCCWRSLSSTCTVHHRLRRHTALLPARPVGLPYATSDHGCAHLLPACCC
jgi:hypothetical protein